MQVKDELAVWCLVAMWFDKHRSLVKSSRRSAYTVRLPPSKASLMLRPLSLVFVFTTQSVPVCRDLLLENLAIQHQCHIETEASTAVTYCYRTIVSWNIVAPSASR
jgi:hypothetical protein